MFHLPYTDRENFELATDEAMEKLRSGNKREAMAQLATALADEPVAPEDEPAKRQAIADLRAAISAAPVEQPKRGQLYDISVARFKSALDQVAPKANREALRDAFTEFAASVKSEARAANAQALAEMMAEVGQAEELHIAKLAVTAYCTKVGINLAAQSQSAKTGRTRTA